MQGEPLEELPGPRQGAKRAGRENGGSHTKDRDHERQENDADRRSRGANRRREQEDLLDQERGRLPEQGRLLERFDYLPPRLAETTTQLRDIEPQDAQARE